MITLTFNYSIAYRGVLHAPWVFDQLEGTVLACGWNNQPYLTRPYTWHAYDGTTQTYYDYTNIADPYNFGAPATVPVAVSLFHTPAPDHYDMWSPYTHPMGLYLRISETVPPPPAWDNYVLSDYYWNGAGPSAPRYFTTDENKWSNDLYSWIDTILGPLFLSPVTHALIADYYGNFGTVDASAPMFAIQLLDIENHPSNVQGSPHGDLIEGGHYNDTLSGGGGDDQLIGRGGRDFLHGGLNADTFIFQALSDSRPHASDVIFDFNHGQGDKIDLAAIDADQRQGHPGNQAFVFIGHQTFAQHYAADPHHHVGMVRVVHNIVQINVNGNLAPDMVITVDGSPLARADFDL